MFKKINIFSSLGILTSTICAIHCILLPILMIVTPTIGYSFIDIIPSEWALLLIISVFGIASGLHGYFFKHCNLNPLIYFFLGISILALSQFFHFLYLEQFFILLGTITLIWAHIKNHTCCTNTKKQ